MCRMTDTGFRWQDAITGWGRWYVYSHPVFGPRYSLKLDRHFKPVYSILVRPRGTWNGRSF